MPDNTVTREQPNISPPGARCLITSASCVFSNRPTPHVLWANLKALDFNPKTDKVRKLELGAGQSNESSTSATAELKPLVPFQFLGIQGLADL
ncbi:hypothetical protein [Comamonas testosteroni]|uniref:hypothetical protein n=1 Tax=Comamonas testosteroni TaxID=285 RepID=UPI0011EC3C85|nr:hypothetical protein [Comamonas testosteroni]